MLAISEDNFDAVNLLLEKGADPNSQLRIRKTPAVGFIKQTAVGFKILKRLLATNKINLNSRDSNGNSLIMMHLGYSSNEYTSKIIKALIDADVSVKSRDRDGNTALHKAAFQNLSIIEALLKAGADAEAINNDDKTPIDNIPPSQEHKRNSIIELFKKYTN